MVKIVLMLALLQYIYNFIFGYKSNILSCGIFGQATDKPENLDVNGVHILGIFNIERGKMSCGLSWDGDIQYGIGFDKLYTDFIVNREIKPTKIPIMIGHTRQPSYGMAITEDNAHPFGFGTSKDGESYEMIFCHNGTLKNHKELAQKYNIDLSEKIIRKTHGGYDYESTRDKIDSEILGEILYKTKKFHVLSEYIGAAALTWTWVDEPNKLYLWSGMSKQTKGSNIVTEIEERPMTVYCKNQNSMFFSSLEESLTVLGASIKDNLQIDYNTVYIITDGDFANAEKHKVSRKNAGQNETIVNNTKYNNYNQRYNQYCDWDGYEEITVDSKPKQDNTVNILNNLYEEKTIKPIVDYNGKVYFKQLRYWSEDNLINGVYIYIKNFGFKFAGIDKLTANNFVEQIKGSTFNYVTGKFNYQFINNGGIIPFKKDNNILQFHYFIDGVLLKTLEDYNRALILQKNLKPPIKHINHITLSHISKHPILDIDNTLSNMVILEGEPFSGNIAELGFEKVYYFNKGLLVKWVKRDDNIIKPEIPVIILPTVKDKELPFDKEIFNNSIENIKTFEEKNFNTILEDELFIKELLLETFEKHSEDISETIIELSDWKDNEIIKNALNTLNLISHTLKDFVEKPNTK